MRSSTHGSLATVLLLIPILAIPMLAIFGVPQFVPRESSSSDEPDSQEDAGDAPAFNAQSDWTEQDFSQLAEQTAATSPRSAFDGALTSASSSGTSPLRLASNQGESPEASLFGESAAPSSYRRPNGTSPDSSHVQQVHATTQAPPLTWQGAVQKLRELQIRSFRLEPGQQVGQFVFICSYTPHHNPRLSYRFEAEADEPLRAVEKVLGQIDSWMAAR